MYEIKKRKILFTESFSMSELCDLTPFLVVLILTRYEHSHQKKENRNLQVAVLFFVLRELNPKFFFSVAGSGMRGRVHFCNP